VKAKPDAMERLNAAVRDVLACGCGYGSQHAVELMNVYRRRVRALLRERAEAAHAATWNALASRVDTALLEHAATKAEESVLGRPARRKVSK